MQLATLNPLAMLMKPKPASQLAHEARVRTVANALQAQDILDQASKMVNEITLIAHRSQATGRSALSKCGAHPPTTAGWKR